MKSKILLLLFVIMMIMPSANAQVEVSSHDITYELLEGKVIVQETILFVNPEKSEVHTFNEEIALLRGGATDIVITGVLGRINDEVSPVTVSLDFSQSPIFRSAAQNYREVTLTYSTKEFTTEGLFDGEDKYYSFIGNILPAISPDLEIDTTTITIKSGDGFQLGAALPETEIVDDRISFFISADDRNNLPTFNVEIQYARFKDLANSNIESAQTRLDLVEERAEDARSAILDASIYDANTSKAEADLNLSLTLINESKFNLVFAEAFVQSKNYYDAYRVSQTATNMLEAAIQAATDAKREANLQLTLALNEKFSQLENRTSATATPSPTTPVVETTPPAETEVPKPTPPKPTPPTVPPVESEETTSEGGLPLGVIIGAIVLVIVAVILVSSSGRKKKDHQAAVKDFRSISDLKKKSYKDFEEKLEDVKKETDTAGEIRRLSAEKKKYELGVENLNKKKLSGEISEPIYKSERSGYKAKIKLLEKKIKILEEELPKKGGFDG